MAIDITVRHTQNRRFYTAFRELAAAAGEQQLQSKDNTVGHHHFQIFSAHLACGSGGRLNVFDGSAGAVPVLGISNGDTSMSAAVLSWDFRRDPLDLTNEDGTSLCISAIGRIQGFIEWGWGN